MRAFLLHVKLNDIRGTACRDVEKLRSGCLVTSQLEIHLIQTSIARGESGIRRDFYQAGIDHNVVPLLDGRRRSRVARPDRGVGSSQARTEDGEVFACMGGMLGSH